NNTISYNDIYNFGMLNHDVGGIYGCCNLDGTGTSTDHNLVHDNQSKDGGGITNGYSGAGIYFHNGSGHFLVHHNVSWNNAGDGIRLNGYGTGNSLSNLVYNNTLAGGQDRSIALGGVTTATGSVIDNNIFRGSTDSYGSPGGTYGSHN